MKDAVLTQINKSCGTQDFNRILALCKEYEMPYFGMFISTALSRQKIGSADEGLQKYYDYFKNSIIKPIHTSLNICLLCNWTENLSSDWLKMVPGDSNIVLVDTNPDYWIIINKPPDGATYIPERTIVFQMEPLMSSRPDLWGEWAVPNPKSFLHVFTHENSFNNLEWHLSLQSNDSGIIQKNKDLENVVSTVLSEKYYDPGHIKRIDFVKGAENIIDIHVFGSDSFCYKSFCSSLPYHKKDDALYPYKYHFNAENHSIPNYFTEKIVDAIMAECLCFYWGCPNISEYIDPQAFIVLDLDDFNGSVQIIQEAIENDEWSKRIHVIRKEKLRILQGDLNIFNRIQKLIVK
jgi:hypothetical protein